MKISVITPVYNGERFIRDTIASVLSQQGDFELEYIICDGESTDGTLAILAEYRDRCTIVSRQDGSPQVAINNGMAMATGDLACWLNADDQFEPGTLQAVADAFRRRPQAQWLYGRCRIVDENNREIRRPITWYKNLIGFCYSRNVLLCENYINQPATFWRLAFWRRTSDLDPQFKAAWDYELWMKMSQMAPAVALHRYLARFRRHSGSISENHFVRQFDEELAIARKYGSWLHYVIHCFNARKIVLAYKLMKG
ncbi:MAG: glycosyltransferase family 2 protein [Victivallales bacterium]|nr:glycosyltransferase family 2 protein [Victivallales bacterium]